MGEALTLGRRSFLVRTAAVAGALVLGFHVPFARRGWALEDASEATEINAWIIIQPDDDIIIRVARSEMGQGIFTSLPMLVAEELECDWTRVRAEYALASDNLRRGDVYGSMATGGSRSVRGSEDYLRQAGATARELLVAAAAARWGAMPADCRAEKGVIRHRPTGREVRFGAVAQEAARAPLPENVRLKAPQDWTLIGTSVKRLDTPDKVSGKAIFGADVRVPGMLYAAIRACPVFGGRLRSYQAQAVEKHRGVVKVVALGEAVAVVADSYWRAEKALQQLPVVWDEGPHAAVDSAAIHASLRAGLDAEGVVGPRRGEAEQALVRADKVIEADYYAPYLAHATMEPMNCTAHVTPEGVEVWVPTQNATAALMTAAQTAGVDPARVVVHNTFLGGGFGRRGTAQDYVAQAVQIAARVGPPVQLIWSREEDMRHGFYRPASMARLWAGLDGAGVPTVFKVRLSAHSIIASLQPDWAKVEEGLDPIGLQAFDEFPYRIPHQRMEYVLRKPHVPVGFWRAVNHTQNAFFRECFIDEVAHGGGLDPYQLRRMLLSEEPKQLAVLDAVAKQAKWAESPPSGTFRGIALNSSYGSHCAQVVEISISEEGKIRLARVVCAIDSGYVVNPDTVVAQVESAVVYGLTAAFYGDITIKDGRVEQGNFNDYPMLLLKDMPKVEVVMVPSGDFWGGLGEPPLPPATPALCNAIFAATGKRIRSLPLNKQGLV
ncbi:MAG: molybdopterin cofactor-binding domain-containing protein [Gammaproteobacteria bacterium]